MNVTEYIASGILESYVMGAVSDQERREVECLSAIYPDMQQELNYLAETLENYALLYSVEPPESVKANLLKQLDFEQSTEREAVVRPMPVDRPSSPTFRVTWIVAASVGLLLLLFSFFLVSQLRTNQKNLALARNNNDSLKTTVDKLRGQQDQANQAFALLSQPGLKTIELKGNQKAPQGNLLVFWNAQTQQIAVSVKSLPALPADKQYQLWSLVNGKPVDAGVFDASNGSTLLQRLNRSIGRADAFAVTVEKRGGSPTPNMATLLALANTKS